ncbi:MAG TPA: hypothetical protein VFF27_09355 [Bacteroidia bacterium]|nr:hypothetical protein [Bacteroidia bacterium]
MKQFIYLSLFILFFSVKASAQTKQQDENTIIGFWMHCDGTVFTYLELKADSTFHLIHQSNLGKVAFDGTFSVVGDALYLKDPKKTDKYSYKNLEIAVYPGATSSYRDFRTLVPTRRSYIQDAIKECNVQRMQEKKAKAAGGASNTSGETGNK